MVRDICKDEGFLAQKAQPATLDDLDTARDLLDTLIAHRIYKSRAGKYGDVLTVFTVLSLGLLRPVFLFAVRNRAAESVPAPECGN